MKDWLTSRYDPDVCHNKAVDLLDTVTREEWEEWLRSPCTQSLLLSIEGDIAGMFLVWSGGGYASEEGANEKALGMVDALDSIASHIRNMKSENEVEEVLNYGYQR